jgi:hypothetical protein
MVGGRMGLVGESDAGVGRGMESSVHNRGFLIDEVVERERGFHSEAKFFFQIMFGLTVKVL